MPPLLTSPSTKTPKAPGAIAPITTGASADVTGGISLCSDRDSSQGARLPEESVPNHDHVVEAIELIIVDSAEQAERLGYWWTGSQYGLLLCLDDGVPCTLICSGEYGEMIALGAQHLGAFEMSTSNFPLRKDGWPTGR